MACRPASLILIAARFSVSVAESESESKMPDMIDADTDNAPD